MTRLDTPSLRPAEKSVSADLFDALLSHAHNVAFFENALLEAVLEVADEFSPRGMSPRAVRAATTNAVQDVAIEVLRQLLDLYLVTRRRMGAAMSTISSGILLEDVSVGTFPPPSRAEAQAIVRASLVKAGWAGKVQRLVGDMNAKTSRILVAGLSRGWTPSRIASTMQKVVSDGRNYRRIVRTEVQRINNKALGDLYENNKGLLRGQQYVATLDARTCPVCQADDGRVYWYDAPPAGGRLVADRPQVPRHDNCRCTYAPVTKSGSAIAGQLGVSVDSLPPGIVNVPEQLGRKLNYEQWLAKQGSSKQLAALGKKRLALWKSGMSITQFATGGRALKLAELEALAPGEIAAIKPVPIKTATPPPIEQQAAGHPQYSTKKPPPIMSKAGVQVQVPTKHAKVVKKEIVKTAELKKELLLAKTKTAELKKIRKRATKTSQEWIDSLNAGERFALKDFTGSGSTTIRMTERGKMTNRQVVRRAERMNKALDRAPVFEGTTWRGMSLDKRADFDLWTTKGNVVTLEASHSTSRARSIAVSFVKTGSSSLPDFGSVLIKTKTKSGVSVQAISAHPVEQEVVLRKGSRYRITRVSRASLTTRIKGVKRDATLVEMEEL